MTSSVAFGAHAPYVWGSLLLVIGWLLLELTLLRHQRREALALAQRLTSAASHKAADGGAP